MLQKMMAEKVMLDIFNPPHHTLSTNIQHELDTLLNLNLQRMKHQLEPYLSPA